MRKTDLAYTAGIIDGEGSIGLYIHRGKGDYVLRVEVGNTNEWLIQWLKFAFGGSTRLHSGQPENHKPLWCWQIQGVKALGFLELVYPYLRLKKPQAGVAIEFQKVRRGTGNHLTEGELAVAEAQRIVMTGLNKKGRVRS